MDEKLEHCFSIRRVKKAADEEYIKALSIYNATTPNDIKTKSNEMSMWLSKTEAVNTFELFIFNLYMDKEIIGLAMLSYIPITRVVVFDYIALKEQYRANVALFAYISLIQNYLSANDYDIDYYIVEISNKNNGRSIDKESRLFKKLICLEGFGRINAKYQTLPLGLEHYESSFNAYIYIMANDSLGIVSKDTYISIVHSIYYEYYLAWYSQVLTLEEMREYKEKVDSIFSTIKSQLSEDIQFNVEYVDCPLLGNLKLEKSFGHIPGKQKRGIKKYPLILMVVLLGPILLIWGYTFVLDLLNISISNVNSIIGGAFTAILSSITAITIAEKKKL